jgi:hypothetical protein
MTTGIPEITRKRFKKKVNWLRWRKAVMPCYYNCPHEYVVRERDLFIPWAPWGCPERDFQFFKKTIRTHGERKKWRHRRDVVLFDGRFVYWQIGPIINRTDRRSMMNGGRPPAEDSERNAKTILADHSRPPEICRRGGKVPSL